MILKGLGGSNPPRSATQSLSLRIPRANRRIARASGLFCTHGGSGENRFPFVTRNL